MFGLLATPETPQEQINHEPGSPRGRSSFAATIAAGTRITARAGAELRTG